LFKKVEEKNRSEENRWSVYLNKKNKTKQSKVKQKAKQNKDFVMDLLRYIFNLPSLFFNETSFYNQIPSNCFGVFVTVRRGQKLSDYPWNVHGCIGQWWSLPKTKREIYQETLDVGKKATFEDSRRNYFGEITLDPKTVFEIDFMLTPVYEVNKETGYIPKLHREFDNNSLGLIVESPVSGERATYLPGVFQNITWSEIKNSLLSKARLATGNETATRFYAYKIHQVIVPFNILFPRIVGDALVARKGSKVFGITPFCSKNMTQENLRWENHHVLQFNDLLACFLYTFYHHPYSAASFRLWIYVLQHMTSHDVKKLLRYSSD
jgi:hypothetical protein